MRACRALLCAPIVLVISAASWADYDSDIAAGVKVAEGYGEALARRDVVEMAKLAHPILWIRFGGLSEYERALRIAYDVKDGSIIKETLGGPSLEFSHGNTRMFTVPVQRDLNNGNVQILYYVLTSYDGGTNWKLFDLACTDGRWLKAIAPDYRGEPTLMIDPQEANKITPAEFLMSLSASSVRAKKHAPFPFAAGSPDVTKRANAPN